MRKRKWIKTKYVGVRYREHPVRKHGVQRDRYYSIRYRVEGKEYSNGLGWSSEGMTAEDAAIQLSELKKAKKLGEGPVTLQEKREEADRKREEERQQAEQEAKETISFGDFFEKTYWPVSQSSKKKESSRKERGHFENWIKPVVGDLPFKDISQIQVERIKRDMQRKDRSPRTIEYIMATFRQVWNLAKESGLTVVDSPSKRIKIHKPDNNRRRYLIEDEADRLLNALKEKSVQTYQISLLSLDTGCRFSEAARLTWRAIDTQKGIITYSDTKMAGGTKSRVVPMTARVKDLFESMERAKKNDLLFPDKRGGVQEKISHSFFRVVKDLKLNEGITDPRDKVVYHTLRHSYASRLVQAGVGLYPVQKLLGHSVSKMTERYSHLSNDTLVDAVRQMETSERLKAEKNGKVVALQPKREQE